ncbi:hypothetical protein [Streptomyces sp. NPDC055692]
MWLTGGAAVLTGAGVVTYAMASPPEQPRGHERIPAVRTLRPADQGEGHWALPQWDTDRFSAALLTWDDPRAELGGTAELRSRSVATGEWSDWRSLPDDPLSADGAEAQRAGVRGGTASVWTGDADGVEVRVLRGDGTPATGLPAGLDVKLLDPGTGSRGTTGSEDAPGSAPASSTGSAQATGSAPGGAPRTVPAARPSTVVRPPVITQAQ